MELPPVAAVEIGTSKIVALVGEKLEDGVIQVIGHAEEATTGVRKSAIVDIEAVSEHVRSVLEKAEKSSEINIREVSLALSGGHIHAIINRGSTAVRDPDGLIGADDVEEAKEIARTIALEPGRDILHTLPRGFLIDEAQRVSRPEGLEGTHLSTEMLVIHGQHNHIHNAIRAVETVQFDVAETVFGGLCSALAVLTPEQKRNGVVVIDLGGGTTDYMAYAGGVVAAAGSFGVGGDHVTNDISSAFNLPRLKAESLKCEHGAATWSGGPTPPQRFPLAADGGFNGREVDEAMLCRVIEARVAETLELVRRRLDEEDILQHLAGGIVLTGGGSRLKGIGDVARAVFRSPCQTGTPRDVTGISEDPAYATCCGLLQYGFRSLEQMGRDGSESMIGSLVRSLLGR
jgi:cell division protein FtsA